MAGQTITDPDTRGRVYLWCYRLLQNHHDALDATQDVLLRSFTRPAQGIENERAWLRRVAINHCIDLVRKRRPAASPRPAMRESPSAASDAASRELHAAIIDGLSRLSERQREVLVAKVYDRETFAAIAESMELSISSVKTHYLRALRLMRGSLVKHVEAES